MSLVLWSPPYLAAVESQSFLPLCGGFGCLPEKSAPHVSHRPATVPHLIAASERTVKDPRLPTGSSR
jgi:hypothetical protein